MLLKGANIIGADSYFIRLSDNKNFFLHPTKNGYVVNEGEKGAAVWHKKEGEELIKYSKAKNLELVNVKEIIGVDDSFN